MYLGSPGACKEKGTCYTKINYLPAWRSIIKQCNNNALKKLYASILLLGAFHLQNLFLNPIFLSPVHIFTTCESQNLFILYFTSTHNCYFPIYPRALLSYSQDSPTHHIPVQFSVHMTKLSLPLPLLHIHTYVRAEPQ